MIMTIISATLCDHGMTTILSESSLRSMTCFETLLSVFSVSLNTTLWQWIVDIFQMACSLVYAPGAKCPNMDVSWWQCPAEETNPFVCCKHVQCYRKWPQSRTLNYYACPLNESKLYEASAFSGNRSINQAELMAKIKLPRLHRQKISQSAHLYLTSAHWSD